MKLVFLDIDGVLNNKTYTLERIDVPGVSVADQSCWDPRSLRALEQIILSVDNLGFVLSSSWRMLYTLREIEEMFVEAMGYSPTFVGITPIDDARPGELFHAVPRGEEINSFLRIWKNLGKSVDAYVIIDDDNNMLPEQQPYFIKTKFSEGLTDAHARQAISILNGEKT